MPPITLDHQSPRYGQPTQYFGADEYAPPLGRSAQYFRLDPIVPLRIAAAHVGVHPDTLKNAAKRGKLKMLRISQRKLGIRESELNRYLNAAAFAA